jgi:hypothetical protein
MRCSAFHTMTQHNRPGISDLGEAWRANNPLRRQLAGESDCFSSFPYTQARTYEIQERRPAQQSRKAQLLFDPSNIHTGSYVSRS